MTSHPTWVRGLKHVDQFDIPANKVSHPTWVRGLKQKRLRINITRQVAPYVGAWIETCV